MSEIPGSEPGSVSSITSEISSPEKSLSVVPLLSDGSGVTVFSGVSAELSFSESVLPSLFVP